MNDVFSVGLIRSRCIRGVLTTQIALTPKEDGMSKVSMSGTIVCQDGMGDEMEKVLAEMVDAAREEPGIEIYSYHRGEGNEFSFFALMTLA